MLKPDEQFNVVREALDGKKIKLLREELVIRVEPYMHGRGPRVAFRDPTTAEDVAVLTVNMTIVDEIVASLKPGELFVKTWSENEEIAADVLTSGLFADTGRRIPTGLVVAQVWTVKPRKLTDLLALVANDSRKVYGLVVLTQHNPTHDSAYQSKVNMLRRECHGTTGKIVKHSDSHGLCFQVTHVNSKGGWWEPDELLVVQEKPPES